jgi:hypothetical protein
LRIDVTYIADATAAWVGGERDIVLSPACFANCEVAWLEGHVGCIRVYFTVFELAGCECCAMMWCLCTYVQLRVGVSRAAGP